MVYLVTNYVILPGLVSDCHLRGDDIITVNV